MTDRYYTIFEPPAAVQSFKQIQEPGDSSNQPTSRPELIPGEGGLDMIPNIQLTRASFDAGSVRLSEKM